MDNGTPRGQQTCYRHPGVPSRLRCFQCDRNICGACAHQTPVATKCPTCIKKNMPTIFRTGPLDWLLIVALPIAGAVIIGIVAERILLSLSFLDSGLSFLILRLLFIIFMLATGWGSRYIVESIRPRKLGINRRYVAGTMPLVAYATTLVAVMLPWNNDTSIGFLLHWTILVSVIVSVFVAVRR